jgi:hypothetical protein
METNKQLGIVSGAVAFLSLPILWLVGVGAIAWMCLWPATRVHGLAQLARRGGWLGMPFSVGRWAWRALGERPYAVAAAAGFLSLLSALISWSFAYVPWILAVSVLMAMIMPTFIDEIAELFGVGRSMNDELDE